jgi:hypothetical protein
VAGFFLPAVDPFTPPVGWHLASARSLHYAFAMKYLISLLVLTLVLSAQAWAVICKMVDADGVVSYSDVPAAECRTPVELPDYSRYTPRPIQQPARPAGDQQEENSEPAFVSYRSIQILQPEPDGTVRSNEGKVPVSIALEPPLQEGHLVRLYVDGEAVRGRFSGVDIELSGLERGSHQLRAEVVDAAGTRQIGSASISFTLRKVGRFDGAQGQPSNPLPSG